MQANAARASEVLSKGNFKKKKKINDLHDFAMNFLMIPTESFEGAYSWLVWLFFPFRHDESSCWPLAQYRMWGNL